jgi:hypothetical protein
MATANKTTMQNASTLLTVSMAMAVWRYNTVRIARRRRFLAFLKATKHRNWVSTCSCLTHVLFSIFISSDCQKRAQVDILAPNNNRGMTYQTDGNNISKTIGFLVGAGNVACYCLNTRLLLYVINQ